MTSAKDNHSAPPGPRGLPLIGSALDLKRDPLQFLQRLASDYGDVASFRLGQRTIYQFNHPDAIHDILVTKNRSFEKTGLVLQAKPILGTGLLTSEGEFHTRQRRMVQPELGPQQCLRFAPIVAEMTRDMSGGWSDGLEIELFDSMLQVTLKVISRALFRFEIAKQARDFEDALTVAIEYFNRLLRPTRGLRDHLPTKRNRQFNNAKQTIDELVYGMIRERRTRTLPGEDVLSRLLAARDVEGDGKPMAERQVRDEVITLLAAGHETIATAMTWTLYLLSRHPAVEHRLVDEVESVLANEQPSAESLEGLKFTRQVLAESMRLYPPLWALSRKAIERCEIGGYVVPEGTIVGVSQYVMHHDSRFFPDPEVFDPSRWDHDSIKARPKFSYFPFGGGPRLCIGEPLAWMEGTLMLAMIIQRWKMQFVGANPVEINPLITLRPGSPVQMRLTARKPKGIAPYEQESSFGGGSPRQPTGATR